MKIWAVGAFSALTIVGMAVSAPAADRHIVDGDLTLFGLTIGKSAPLPNCVVTTVDVSGIFQPKMMQSKWAMPAGADGCVDVIPPASVFGVELGAGQSAALLKYVKPLPLFVSPGMDSVAAILEPDSIIAVLNIKTGGYDMQELTFAALKDKFGEPTVSLISKRQNGYGAVYDIIEAGWKFSSGATLEFDGITGNLHTGLIVAKSAATIAKESSVPPIDSRSVKF